MELIWLEAILAWQISLLRFNNTPLHLSPAGHVIPLYKKGVKKIPRFFRGIFCV